jgi:uncharacterized protein (DUF362 family)
MLVYGPVYVETNPTAQSVAALIAALNLTPPVLIKPNWGTVESYTDTQILDWTLEAIPGEKLVIESHGWARNQETLHQQPSGALTKANLRKGNNWFLDYSGARQVLAKHQVEYLNLTEEIWAGRTADPALIRQAVEQRFSPLQFEEMYEKVPVRLYDLRGGSLLSLSKYKLVFYPLGASLAIKNLFGLIPGPSRGKYHGENHVYLDQSIVDINKIYRSLFSVKGIIETVNAAGFIMDEAERTQTHPVGDMLFASQDTLSLDAFASQVGGRDPDGIGHLHLAAQTFGGWDPRTCLEAERSGIKIRTP